MKNILQETKEPIFYITNDVGHGIGLESVLPNYHVICLDDHPVIDILKKNKVPVFCLERELGNKNEIKRSSGVILGHPLVLNFIKEKSSGERPNILFFKPQKKIEIICKENNFNLIGNTSELNDLFEDKISFFEICRDNQVNTPKAGVFKLNDLKYDEAQKNFGDNFVVQFGRGWAGSSTHFIKEGKEFTDLKTKLGSLKVKIGKYISGITVINNAVIFNEKVFSSQPAIQINSNSILSSKKGGTGGRMWPSGLEEKQIAKISQITNKVGKIMLTKGYKGFFGLDFIVEENSGEILLSECNARLTASVPFFTKLELAADTFPLLGYHLLSFLKHSFEADFYEAPLLKGSEIVARNTSSLPVCIKNEFRTGKYDDNLNFIEESFFPNNLKENELFITTAALGRVVNPEIEIIKINTNGSVCDLKGNCFDKYLDIVKNIKTSLGLEEC